MLKKIASAACFATLMVTLSATLAANTQALENTNVASVVSSAPSTKDNHVVANSSRNTGETADAGTLSPSAWMLAFALVGFVLLSNRRAI